MMRTRWTLVLLLAGCGDDGGGAGGPAPTEQPMCNPPELTCDAPTERHLEGRTVRTCPDDLVDVTTEDATGKVAAFGTEDGTRLCWPNGTVAMFSTDGDTDPPCWDEAGEPADCEPIAGGGWRDAWGF